MRRIDPSEITPEHIYLNRRELIKGMGALAAASFLAACTGDRERGVAPVSSATPASGPAGTAEELEHALTPYDNITGFVNFYEFSLSKTQAAELAQGFRTSPWEVEVGGLVHRPRTFGLEELLAFEQEERIYRMRCVEGWSMVIPWNGFPLSRLLKAVDPTSEARFVRFETLYDPEQMPGQRSGVLEWPYVEGLRLDEAMHDLTILATGLYGKELPPQNGAPVRLVVPWKYGFKSLKSIVRFDLTAEMPVSSWMAAAPRRYGFYANVNPNLSPPIASQPTELVVGTGGQRATELFNGYGEDVAELYAGMDLEESF